MVAAFHPDTPIWSTGRRFTVDGVEVPALGWLDRFIAEPRDRRLVATWASCTARGESVRERFRDLGWSRSTAERRRKAAMAAIAAGLNAAGDEPCSAG